jgi:hypothetical protein
MLSQFWPFRFGPWPSRITAHRILALSDFSGLSISFVWRMVGSMDHRTLKQQELILALQKLATAIVDLTQQPDEILQEAALLRLAGIQDEVQSFARGKVVFSGTETWRTVYEQILRCPDVSCYRSIAWIRNEDYWQDIPGRRCMQLNYDLLQDGVSIERILILSDFFWAPAALLPAADIRRWIDEQHQRGLSIRLVREADIDTEVDILCDIGIYGTRATGTWELDPQCRTTRFTFDFSPEGVRLAEERWKQLSLYAIPYAALLDQAVPRR